MHATLVITLTTALCVYGNSVTETNLQRSCVRIVARSEEISYSCTETECRLKHILFPPLWQCQSRVKNDKKMTLKYTYKEAVCCSGYREISDGDEFKCEPYPELAFQLLFTNMNFDCQSWKNVYNSHNVSDKFSVEIERILTSICGCNSTQFKATDIQLLCIEQEPNMEIFQGRIASNKDRNLTQLADDIEKIALEKKTISVLNEELMALDNCTCCVIIQETDLGYTKLAEECFNTAFNSHSISETEIEEAVGGSVGFVLIVVFAVVLCLLVYFRYRARRRGGGLGDRYDNLDDRDGGVP